ncbi:hypothetical protein A3D70_01200 [Candidatus Adlerbacteria bacterium RIFCSPHIGHO2_02_FULL_54_18]|uniref:Uncharacterized protein n=2 Tax=Candidatus Adleribacteriota TaxID=1752736 RepID=A0A1F4Y4Y8_9BACT|nr:MAG: hypothetical protein A2949_02135 [Candidatus Adlerbacteria bacterium RIFCSPLOWO2_01_FULL_54_21b]OGC89035.1 MAG: hypothetical protein A3D70_01200 [Candidatus Adlerbacteria bacterium RIFCSPHIGHO2_02_FULL_54_18]
MKKVFFLLAAATIVLYGLFEARKLLEGPDITFESPLDGSATSTVAVTVVGTAQNISFLTINDAPSYTDERGKFVYRFSPPAGYTVVTVAAVDRFGRRASKSITFNVVTYCIENYGV